MSRKRGLDVWLSELWFAGGIYVTGAALAYGLDLSLLWLGLFPVVWLAWHLFQIARLLRSLQSADRRTPEWTPGIWREVYYQLYLLHRRRRRREQRMLQVVGEFRDSTHAMQDAAVILGEFGEIYWLNPAAQAQLGLDPRRDIGQRIANLIRHPRFVAFEAQSTDEQSLDMPSPVNQEQILSVRIVHYRKRKRLLIARDVTRLQKLEQVRQTFVANVSHELRTPITVLMGYLETILESGEEHLGRYVRPMRQMQQQSLRMRSIVDDLLLLSRLDSERTVLSAESIDVARLVRSMADDARVLSGAQRHRIVMEVAEDVSLKASPKELQSAFWNLVSNAVRYTPEGGTITLRWGRDAQNRPTFSVTDTGVGIEAIHLPRLTERFYRVDAGRSREVGGTGLGLSIVKHVLERHGAHLQVESEIGKGSTFSCVFAAAGSGLSE